MSDEAEIERLLESWRSFKRLGFGVVLIFAAGILAGILIQWSVGP